MLREKREKYIFKFEIRKTKRRNGNSLNTNHEKRKGGEQWHVPLKPYASYL